MFENSKELKEVLQNEKELYQSGLGIRGILFSTNEYLIWRWQKTLRKCEYYQSISNIFGKILYVLYKVKKNILAKKVMFDIPNNCFDTGLHIYHIGPIFVNENARIGKNCIIVGNCVIGGVRGKIGAPILGDNIYMGANTTIIGNIHIGDNVNIGAGTVVVKSCKDNATIVGSENRVI